MNKCKHIMEAEYEEQVISTNLNNVIHLYVCL